MATTQFTPTDEQLEALRLFRTGNSLALEALAGAGKTSTLRLAAEQTSNARGVYVAFNRKIVDDAKGSFPGYVKCSTAHGLAFAAVGKDYAHRLRARRMSARDTAQALGLDFDTPIVVDVDDETREIHATTLATAAKLTVDRFCSSADEALAIRHVYRIPGIDAPDEWTNHDKLAPRILGMAEQIWADVTKQDGGLHRFEHGHYLKMWQLRRPRIHADFLLFDEAQDANPVMRAIVEAQTHLQLVYVGDSNQAIYEWTGAVDALGQANVSARARLTESFRFGPEIAEQANLVLRRLGAGVEVTGSGPGGTIGPASAPNCVLGRTNAAVVVEAIDRMAAGQRVALQGGTREIVWFAEAAEKLQAGEPTNHPELACFPNWGAVQVYVESDAGKDLKSLVGLVDRIGARELIRALEAMVDPKWAEVICSTAHKAKGAEWGTVQLLDDFPFPQGEEIDTAELRLLYVAVTRAKQHLDATAAVLNAPADLTGVATAGR